MQLAADQEIDTLRAARRKVVTNIVVPCFLISVMAYIDRNNLSYAKLTMLTDLQFSESVYGFGAGIFFLGYLLFEVPGALVAERTSPKLWLARIMITWGLLTGLMACIRQPWQFYWLRFLIGVAEASLYPVLYASVVPRWFRSEDRARAIAIMLCSLQVSSIIGAPLAGWLIEVPLGPSFQGWQALFILEAIPAIVLGCIVVFWMADSPQEAWWLSDGERAALTNHLSTQTDSDHRSHRPLWSALIDRTVIKLCCIYFLWMTGFWGFNYYTPTILKELGWSSLVTGWLVAGAMAMSLVVMLGVGHSSSVTGEKRWHGAVCMFVAALGFYAGTHTNQPWIAYACLCLAGIGVYAALGVWWSYPTTFLSGTAAAGAVGMINSIGSSGGFLGPYITGVVKDVTGSVNIAWTALAVCLLAAGGLILTLRARPIRQA